MSLGQALEVMARADALLARMGLPCGNQLASLSAALQEALRALFRPAPQKVRQSKWEALETELDALPREYPWESEPAPDTVIAAEQVRTLLTDVVRRASHDWVLYRTSSRLDQRELAHDAYVWLFEEKPGHPNWELRKQEDRELTSFLAICETIDIDPAYARRQIRLLTPRDVKMAGRPAERRHRQSLDTAYYSEHSVCGEVPDSAFETEL